MTMTIDQLEAVNDSDALCEGCGANPRDAETLDGWFIDSVLLPDDGPDGFARVARVRCPTCR
jgi:hypothetical protein